MLPVDVRSLLIYKFTCSSSCNSAYVGKTKRHFLVRMFEHLGISLNTSNNYTYNPKNNNNTAVLNHINSSNCNATLDHFWVIGAARNDFLLCLCSLIQLYEPILNKKREKHATHFFYTFFLHLPF